MDPPPRPRWNSSKLTSHPSSIPVRQGHRLIRRCQNNLFESLATHEEAKKFYVLDGHVSDHVHLLQQQSKLYHYLATFEAEPKRKLAMETRRATLLLPMLKTLSRASYEGLHKQISYELGEAYLNLLDIKVEKLRAKHAQGVVDPRHMKSAEISNCNNYVRGGLAMFSHYISFFLPVHLADGKETHCTRPAAVSRHGTQRAGLLRQPTAR